MGIAKLPLSLVLLAVFALLAFGHADCLMRFVSKGANFSAVPFVGGIAGGLGVLLSTYPNLHHLWWLPSILDYGSIPCAALWLFSLVSARSSY